MSVSDIRERIHHKGAKRGTAAPVRPGGPSREPGKGKFAGKLGALRVRADDGREFSIGSALTDADREAPPRVGTVITYRFQGLTAKGLPRFPFLFARGPGLNAPSAADVWGAVAAATWRWRLANANLGVRFDA